MVKAVDFGSHPPPMADLHAVGIQAVGRYYSPFKFNYPKQLTREEIATYKKEKINLFAFYEGATDTLAKPGTGKAVLDLILEAHRDLGLTERPVVYASLDIDSLNPNYPNLLQNLIANMKVISDGWGLAKTGFYGDYRAAKAVYDAKVASYFCLPAATAWGGGRPSTLPSWINLVQGGQYKIGGVTVDTITVRTPDDYGQIFDFTEPAPTPTPPTDGSSVSITFTTYQNKRVTPWMKYCLQRADKWLYTNYKLHLVLRDAIRTYEEQKRIFLSRYVTAGNINGRRVYDTRWWNGQLWYRISSAGTVAVPGTSNHEIQGTNGAVDIADTGADAGITVKGSKRGLAFRAVCRSLGFINEGDSFGEGWHFKVPNIDKAVPGKVPPSPTPPTGGGTSLPSPSVMLKWHWKGIQRMLKSDFGYKGEIDGIPGDGTKMAFRRFMNAKGYSQKACGYTLAIKPIWTVNDVKAAQYWLNATGRKAGTVDGNPGSQTHTAWDKAEEENYSIYAWVK